MMSERQSGARVHPLGFLAASVGGLLFGFDTAVISGVTEALRLRFALSPEALGNTVAVALWGTLIGALAFGKPGDRHGSRNVLRFIAVLYAVSAVGCAIAWDVTSFALFRFIGGLAIGGTSVLAPVYVAEIAPPARRGLLVGLFQCNIVLGILLAFVSNAVIGQLGLGEMAWRIKLGVVVLPALVFLGMLMRIPQSPRWLMLKGRTRDAMDAAVRLRLPSDGDWRDARSEGEARLDWSAHRKPILLAIAIGLFNQLSGINAILYYLNDIFAGAGFDSVSADLQAVAVGATNLVATLIAMTMIDRLGRRRLLIAGGIGCALPLLGVAGVYGGMIGVQMLLPFLILFIFAFAMSQGAVIWVYLSEIFPSEVRARGHAIGSSTHWAAAAVISTLFPIVAAHDKVTPFILFAASMLLQAVIVARFFPETRGVRLEDMGSRMH